MLGILQSAVLLSLALSVLFARSGVGKLRHWRSAESTITALRLPAWVPGFAVVIFACVEVLIAVALLGNGVVVQGAAIAAFVCAAVFLVLVVRAYRLGSADECGCFGASSARVGPWLIVRNAVLVATTAALVALTFVSPLNVVWFVRALQVSNDPLSGWLPLVAAVVLAALAVSVFAAEWAGRVQPADREHPEHPGHSGVSDAANPSPALGPLPVLDAATGVARDLTMQARQKAQLVLFVQAGCGSCQQVLAKVAEARDAVEQVAELSVVAGVWPGRSGTEATGGDERLTTLDPANASARQLGLGSRRPQGVLLATDGSVVQPVAQGADEIAELIDAVAAAAPTFEPREG
ncbi:MauE/DoxX family redox-associated membrane protein [Microbacterium sp. YY-01]|uniref:MauE/DoxX family redox-associated membrane protein n=1 Tax=Microbacterium sp. YY-01 TaxID=3421634 RepID=UPI003D171403